MGGSFYRLTSVIYPSEQRFSSAQLNYRILDAYIKPTLISYVLKEERRDAVANAAELLCGVHTSIFPTL